MEEDDYNTQKVGVGAAGIQIIILSRGTCSVALWLKDLGGHPPHGKVPRGVIGTGGNTSERAAPVAET